MRMLHQGSTGVLATKIRPPSGPVDFALRSRVDVRIQRGLEHPVALICAPAGYGKTLALVSALAESRHPVAWVSLDEGDDDAPTFLSLLVAAIRTSIPDACPETLAALNVPDPVSPSFLARAVREDLEALPVEVVLILDDYDSIQHPDIHAIMDTLVRHPPSRLHLLIATRETPSLPLNHVPLIVSHPALQGGTTCSAVTSHVDLVPTILGLTGRDISPARGLLSGAVGKDFSSLLLAPQAANPNAVREGALYNFSMLLYLDPDFLRDGLILFRQRNSMSEDEFKSQAQTLRPDWTHRGAIRSVFDGRYRFSRYLSLREHHTPRTLEELRALNDLELFDLQNDPLEERNLAADLTGRRDLIVAMNDKLNALIEREVGVDDGSHMPFADGIQWSVDPTRRFKI